MKKIKYATYLHIDLLDSLKAYHTKTGITITRIVSDAIREYLEKKIEN